MVILLTNIHKGIADQQNHHCCYPQMQQQSTTAILGSVAATKPGTIPSCYQAWYPMPLRLLPGTMATGLYGHRTVPSRPISTAATKAGR